MAKKHKDELASDEKLHRQSPFLMDKIIFGMCDVDLSGILVLRGDVSTRRHRYKIVQEHCANNTVRTFSRNVWLQSGTVSHHPLSTSAHSLDLNVR